MKIQVRLNNYRRSAKKVREIIPVIKGLGIDEAEDQLAVLTKSSAKDLKKLLLSAVATAKNDFKLDSADLQINNIIVQEGKTLKRWRARAYGRAAQILKRTCHIVLTLEQKVNIDNKSVEKKNWKIDSQVRKKQKGLSKKNKEIQQKKIISKRKKGDSLKKDKIIKKSKINKIVNKVDKNIKS